MRTDCRQRSWAVHYRTSHCAHIFVDGVDWDLLALPVLSVDDETGEIEYIPRDDIGRLIVDDHGIVTRTLHARTVRVEYDEAFVPAFAAELERRGEYIESGE